MFGPPLFLYRHHADAHEPSSYAISADFQASLGVPSPCLRACRLSSKLLNLAERAFGTKVRMLTMVIPLRTIPDATRPPRGPTALRGLLAESEPKDLLVLGSGPLPVEGAWGGMVALDATGATVLAIGVASLQPRTPAQIADELDLLAQMGVAGLRTVESHSDPAAPIEARFARFFGVPAVTLNQTQAAVLVVEAEPSPADWLRLKRELGARLRGVFRLEGKELVPMPIPEQEARARLSLLTKVALGALGVGVVLALVALLRLTHGPAALQAAGAAQTHTVTGRVSGAATHTQWIGQQHMVHTQDGRLLVLTAGRRGLEIVSDRADNGAAWEPPARVAGIHPGSFAAAIDVEGRLHIAYSDGRGVAYTVLTPAGGRWQASKPVRLDRGTKTPVVDIAWDETRQLAHVVWAKVTPRGQEPYWTAVSFRGGKPRPAGSRALSPAGKAVPVLVDEAIDPSSGSLLVTYRGGRSVYGWSSRSMEPRPDGSWSWGGPERLPTRAFIGAAAVAVGPDGVAHLVLRDSTSFQLLYFTHQRGAGWSQAEAAVQAHATSQLDFPALALDDSSRLVYLFYESDQFETAPEIRVAVRDPDSGWLGSTAITSLPEGAYFPTALRDVSGQAIVAWTEGTSQAAIDLARVSGP